jgi:hypothetical protein
VLTRLFWTSKCDGVNDCALVRIDLSHSVRARVGWNLDGQFVRHRHVISAVDRPKEIA